MGNVGAEDSAGREALRRLMEWIIQFSGPEEALAAAEQGLEFTESRALGGVWALDALWNRLGIGPSARRLLAGSGLDGSAERVLFALVANRRLPRRSCQPPTGSARTSSSMACPPPPTTRAIGRRTGCWRSGNP